MSRIKFVVKAAAFFALTLAFTSLAQAQATRTFVSGVGNDADPCSRTAPCRTFAGALIKTATGGEISVLDPGGYGSMTINKAITVDGTTGAGYGSTLFSGAASGFTINITTNSASDKVILRNLSINGAGSILGVDGVRFLDGEQLTLESVSIFNFSGDGIEINQSQPCRVFLRDVSIQHGNIGIKSNSSASAVVMRMQDVRIDAMNSHGIQAINNTAIFARDVTSSRNGLSGVGDGFRAEGNTTINCKTCLSFANFSTGYNAVGVSANVRIIDSDSFNNATGIAGNVRSAGNNRFAANGVNGSPAATDITIQ